jgi:hypothetical protein
LWFLLDKKKARALRYQSATIAVLTAEERQQHHGLLTPRPGNRTLSLAAVTLNQTKTASPMAQ